MPQNERDFELLSGYVAGPPLRPAPEAVEAFKRMASESSDFAPSLPMVCWLLGIADSDIPLVVFSLRSGRLPPWRLMPWTTGGVLAEVRPRVVAPLFDALLDDGVQAFGVAVDLMGMYSSGPSTSLRTFGRNFASTPRSSCSWRRASCTGFRAITLWSS